MRDGHDDKKREEGRQPTGYSYDRAEKRELPSLRPSIEGAVENMTLAVIVGEAFFPF